MAPSTAVTNLEFIILYIKYALFPDEAQKVGHYGAVRYSIKHIIEDIIKHFIIHYLFWDCMVNKNNQINYIINLLILILHCMVIITDIALIRDCLTKDLVDYLIGKAPTAIWSQYGDLGNSLKEYWSYRKFDLWGKETHNTCAICLDEYAPNSYHNQTLLWCGHRYHTNCLSLYENALNQSQQNDIFRCPSCRNKYRISLHKYQYNPYYYQEAHILYRQSPSFMISSRKKIQKMESKMYKLGTKCINGTLSYHYYTE